MSLVDIKVRMSDGSTRWAELVKLNKKTAVVRLLHKKEGRGMNHIKVSKDRIHFVSELR